MTPSADREPVANREVALKRLCGNETLFAKMAEFFLADAPGLMQQITDAYQSEQWDTVSNRAHGLRGLSATFEAIPVVALTREVEQIAKVADKTQLGTKIDELRFEFDRLCAYLQTIVKPADDGDAVRQPTTKP